MKLTLDQQFWNNRYINVDTRWDIGYVSTPIKAYIDQLVDKEIKILIPGCGNSYEGEYLHTLGFKHVYLMDLSEKAFDNFKKRVPTFPKDHLLVGDFFELEDKFDLIIEQTFFCAINIKLRVDYVLKMNELLKPKGQLVGLLFDAELNTEHPPFGGSKEEYLALFSPFLEINTMEIAYNSIPSRKDRELFIKLAKKN